jgi:hypothetical protein
VTLVILSHKNSSFCRKSNNFDARAARAAAKTYLLAGDVTVGSQADGIDRHDAAAQ